MRIRANALIAGFVAGFMGCSATFAAAQGNSQNKAPSSELAQNPGESKRLKLGTTVRNGTIMSMNASRMVVVLMHKGKAEQLEVILNSATVRKGEIVVGSQVTVHYRTENNQNIATSIQKRTPAKHPAV
jgi:hypothetical protein